VRNPRNAKQKRGEGGEAARNSRSEQGTRAGRREAAGEDLETRWQRYLQGDEYLTYQMAVELIRSRPPTSRLTECRSDFELLLHSLHRLGCELGVEHTSKGYRAHYSPDVQLCGYLYSTLLTAFTLLPSYVLNGQEFYVSDTVLDQCNSLQQVFAETCDELMQKFESLQPCSFEHIRSDVKRSLVYFDRSWCRFEMPALEEIEAIHRQACRPLIEAIDAEQALADAEAKATGRSRGNVATGAHRARLEVQRNRLMEKMNELNRLANIDGKGRSDMDMTCVLEAERIITKPICSHLRGDEDASCQQKPAASQEDPMLWPLRPPSQPHRCNGCVSPVLLRIAKSLMRAFDRLRRVLQRYGRCLYQLNSHLANNADLVRALELLESSWETASRYLVQTGPRRLANLAYGIVSSVHNPSFEAALTNLDPGFLVAALPRAFVLHEMQRYCTNIRSAEARHADRRNAQTAAAKGPKLSVIAAAPDESLQAQCSASSMLPRVLDVRKAPASAGQVSAFQFSPIARTFLPSECVEMYNETASMFERLPARGLAQLQSVLILACCAVSRGGSINSTPLVQQASHKAAEAKPCTPCPPRMVVPAASANKEAPPAVETTDEEDSDDESQTLVLKSLANATFSGGCDILHAESCHVDGGKEPSQANRWSDGGDATPSHSQTSPHAEPSRPTATPGHRSVTSELGQDPATKQVIASISTLALHIQRKSANEWNELVQVVLQGLMLARSHGSNAGGGKFAAEEVW